MRDSEKYKLLKKLLKRPSFTSAEARKLGVSSSLLCYYAKTGLIEKVDRGIFKNPKFESKIDFQWQDLIETALSIKGGVICLTSALAYWDITEEMPREFWIAIPNSSKKPKRKMTRIVRMRNIKLGLKKVKVDNTHFLIFDVERTIIDSFRMLSIETAIKALKYYINDSRYKTDYNKLMKYSKALRVNIEPYILAATTV